MKTATPAKFKETKAVTVPKGWELKTFSELTINFDNKRKPLSSMQRSKRHGAFPYYGASGIVDYIDDYIFDETLLLISEDGENLKTRKTAVAFFAGGKYWVNNHAHVIKNKPNIDLRFIKYWFDANHIAPYLSGSVQPKLSRSNLDSIEILTPEFSEQKQIAEILSSLDDKIELNRKINANLEKLASSLFKKWFVDIGDELPEGWRTGELREVLELNYGRALKAGNRENGQVKVYGSSGFVGFHDTKLVEGPGIIVGRKGNVGSVFWSNEDFYPIDTTYFVTSKLPLIYCYYLLKNQKFVNGDSVVPGLNRDQAYRTEIVLPGKNVLEKFSTIASELRKSFDSIEREIEVLVAIRDSLLPRLMSGKIRV